MLQKYPLEFKFPEPDQPHYFNVTNEGFLLNTNPEQHRITFWDNIFEHNKQQWNTTFNFHSV